MTTILYYSRDPNPRLTVVAACHLGRILRFAWRALFDAAQKKVSLKPKPSLGIPIFHVKGSNPFAGLDALFRPDVPQ